MDSALTSLERERAFDAFCRIVDVHVAALQVLTLVSAMPDGESFLEAQIKLRRGMRDDPHFDVGESAAEYMSSVRAERARGFETMRRLTLVSMCGALEYLIKAVLVDQAATDVGAAASLLAKSKVRLPAADVLGLSQKEQWFAVADQIFKSLGEGGYSMHQRSTRFLSEFAHMPPGNDQRHEFLTALGADESRRFDEAFLVRNCLVHNGGLVSAPLARYSGKDRGAVITLDQKYGASLIMPIRKFATAVNSVWCGSL